MNQSGEYLIGRDGRPVLDRFGRPIRVRPRGERAQSPQDPGRKVPPPPSTWQAPPRSSNASPAVPPRSLPPRSLPPRQQPPPAYLAGQGQRMPRREAGYVPQAPGAAGAAGMPGAPGAPGAAPFSPPQAGRANRASRASRASRAPRATRFRPRLRLRIGGFISFLLVFMLVFTLWADTRLHRVVAMPAVQVAKTSGTNWLLVGSDSRTGMSEAEAQRLGTGGDIGSARADTMMLLHIPLSGKATLVSLPRDSYVEVPGYGMNKLNAAFFYGGAPLLVETVEKATELHISHYAEIGMGGLAAVVDAVGGTKVCPTEAINDPLAKLDIQPGCQEVDGSTALGYVRTRATSMGDLDRVARQREFFASLLQTATKPSTLLNPFRLIPLVNRTAGAITVHQGDHIWHLARVAFAMRRGVETHTVEIGGFADYDVGNVALWDPAAAAALFESLR
ncbi:LCP family protein [Corynebacterium caspium]|uniref:LCP family protein n=1 Tax=Corynebacterium caspium TaxID=234828 RepID=UPI00035F9708|nr:LCP family protein [Corynebacterium caspium]WKD60001.1 Putative transcriptional regulator YwtF [Corynebacterium caspium DSM 44850]